MTSELTLAFDTSAAACAVAVLSCDAPPRLRVEEMAKGQSERLMPLIEELLGEVGATWQHISHVGVGVGPGNFTGVRIAVSAARGLALGLKTPVIGITGFDLCDPVEGPYTALVSAPRGQAYACQMPDGTPELLSEAALADLKGAVSRLDDVALDTRIARMAALTRARAPFYDGSRPAPLYLRAPDAAPSSVVPPRIIG